MSAIKLNLIALQNFSIYEQLLLEEKLLRSSKENFCIINHGSSKHIVMGISGKVEELVDVEKVRNDKVAILKRFSGGGTVIVDEETIFVTFIFEAAAFDFPPFPERIHKFSESLYKPVFKGYDFALRENDYVIGDKKIGGNAQYIKKDRWLHHTSFLWDYKKENMDYLLLPKKRPQYRQDREHDTFLSRLKSFFESKEGFLQKLEETVMKEFELKSTKLPEIQLLPDCRISTTFISI